ncbi:hypothetical protein H4J57_04170 [Colwellia sp. BRX8-7]|jgi:hypothetical protein|uniref:hypothetical protein n=1 Tax=Colwellia sp. BRX8-7 TaxID=2759833 RepID=UPI0015F454EB|nr:hypothetical protein [Colwellia sp. BRX8-7]MBA6336393.1 hypothetical protein [Colwellia sp. BRX8-7]
MTEGVQDDGIFSLAEQLLKAPWRYVEVTCRHDELTRRHVEVACRNTEIKRRHAEFISVSVFVA